MAHETQHGPRWRCAGLLLTATLGLAACGGSSYPPARGCTDCASSSASAAARAEILAADRTRRGAAVSATAESRRQVPVKRNQVASASLTLPLPPETDSRLSGRAAGADSAGTGRVGPPVTLVYAQAVEQLTLEMKNQLRMLALDLRRDDDLRVELQAYASLPDGNQSRARHVALNRAMAVRAYLIEQDVDLDQLDVRALGDRAGGRQADRVDIVPARRG